MNNSNTDIGFTPFRLRGLTLRNRFIKTAAHEGMTPGGEPTQRLLDHHLRVIEGGVALTTVAYGGVNDDALTHQDQMVIGEPVLPFLQDLAGKVHLLGGAVSMQLTHCGFFSKSSRYRQKRPLAPSPVLNKYGLMRGRGFAREMTENQIRETVRDFGRSAGLLKGVSFDAVEIHMGHGYLLSQFLTPGVNKRTDRYGGTLENRMRFPLEVLHEVRRAVGDDFPVVVKMNMTDAFPGGLEEKEALQIGMRLEKEGADALILSGGYTSKTPFFLLRGDIPLKEMIRAERDLAQRGAMAVFGRQIIKKYDFEENFFLEQAKRMRQELSLPLVYVGGVVSSNGIAEIFNEGFELIALGRALIHDPDFILKVRDHAGHRSGCNSCNVCVGEIERTGVYCPVANSK